LIDKAIVKRSENHPRFEVT